MSDPEITGIVRNTYSSDPASIRYDRYKGEYVPRNPYYYRDNLIPYLVTHPIHYILFSQCPLYRWYIGGVWHNNHGLWIRMEDRRRDEFCDEHTEMEPCRVCRVEWEVSQQP